MAGPTQNDHGNYLPPAAEQAQGVEAVEAAKFDPDPFPGTTYVGIRSDAEQHPIPASGLVDSGQRVVTATGAVRERAPGKGRFDLISPVVEERLAKHMEAGAIKYGDGRNWEAGLPLSFYVDATRRHLGQFLQGQTDEDHLAAALWNVHCLLHTEEMIRRGAAGHTPDLNDLPGTRGAYSTGSDTVPVPEMCSTSTQRMPGASVKTGHIEDGRLCQGVPCDGCSGMVGWVIIQPGSNDPAALGAACDRAHEEI